MKNHLSSKWISVIILLLLFSSCIKTDDFSVPEQETLIIENDLPLVPISAVISQGKEGEIVKLENPNLYFEGYVISSDEGGNFYKKLVIQDKNENPQAGIQILVDDATLYTKFNFGRKIQVKLDGLSLWKNNGVFQLGIQNRGDVVNIPSSLIDNFITRTSDTSEIIPLPITIEQLNSSYNNLYVSIDDVQFNRNLIRDEHRYTFSAEITDQYDGERQLESCVTGGTINMSTSTFSDFKALLLPQFIGKVTGVLSRNFYDDQFVIILNTPKGLDFNDNGRCDPVFFKCEETSLSGTDILFEEDFVGISNEAILDGQGWTNINVSGGSERFEDAILNGNRFIRISAYNTLETPLEAWLITPPVNLDQSSNETLSFDIKASYDNATILSVLITTNFTGNPLTTTWKVLEANIPVGPSRQSGFSFIKSEIPVNCFNGKIWVAFKYLGADPDKSTTYDIDNIRIVGNQLTN